VICEARCQDLDIRCWKPAAVVLGEISSVHTKRGAATISYDIRRKDLFARFAGGAGTPHFGLLCALSKVASYAYTEISLAVSYMLKLSAQVA
jgi:hypothetical protein